MADNKSRVAAPQDFAAGIFLLLLGAFAWWAAGNLNMGTLRSIGPGMLPKSLAAITAGLGVLLILTSLRTVGPDREPWNWRAIFFILLGVSLFALTIRGASLPFGLTLPPLGLVVSGPLVALVSAMASPETRRNEVVIFATVMTIFCALLFKYALGLPIPLAPWALGY